MAFRSSMTAGLLVFAATAASACGGSKEEPDTAAQANAGGQYGQQGYPQQQQGYPQQQQGYPQQQQGYPQQQQGYPQQQQGYPQQQQGQPGAPPGGQGGGQMGMPGMGGGAPAGSSAQQLDPSAGAAATAILTQLATGSIQPGAKPVGSAVVGNFQQGQSLESQLQLQPGKCYTVVAAGVPPVTEVNVQLVAVMPIPGMVPVLAQDSDQGPQAVLGRKPNCYKWPMPMGAPVKVVLTAAGGSGLVAAQVYEK